MPIFPPQDDLYRLFQRESPENAYADGVPGAFFSTADNYANAKILATAYLNLQVVYNNFFPAYADEKIADWEIAYFGMVADDSTLTLLQRQQRVIAKIRERKDLSLWTILTAILTGTGTAVDTGVIDPWVGHEWLLDVSQLDTETFLGGITNFVTIVTVGFVPAGTPVQIELMADDGWTLDVSKLSLDTYLGARRSLPIELGAGFDFCNLPNNSLWNDQKTQAYTYVVRIFGYTLTTDQRTALDAFLTQNEPARSTHLIVDNLTLSDYGLNFIHTNVSRSSLENCLYTDPVSSTGFSARSANA